jgi:two-component system NtrC family sensor kinase
VPIPAQDGENLGSLCAIEGAERAFQQDEIRLMEIFARYVGREVVRLRLETQLRQAEDMKRLGQLTSGVAHEVRNPLNAMLSVIEALFVDIGDEPEYQPYLEHVRIQGNRLSALMNDLLELGKPLNEDRMQVLDVHQLIENAVGIWSAATAHGDHEVRTRFELPDRGATVRVDGTKMHQVILNLLENACQHSPEGSTIDAVAVQTGNRVAVCVTDRGTGMDPSALDRAFEPFFTTRKQGTGLGLSIVRHIVHMHDGRLEVRNNQPAPGLTVEFTLPLYTQESN